MNLREKLAKVMKDVGFIEFDGSNTAQRYKYASAAGVLRKINVALAEQGLCVGTGSEVLQYMTYEDDKGRTATKAVVRETITIMDSEGKDFVLLQGVGEGKDLGDKAVMKASTAATKYAWAHGLVLGWGAEDPEGDTKTDEKLTAKDVQNNIDGASNAAALKKIRKQVLAFKGKAGYDKLTEAYKAKEESFK